MYVHSNFCDSWTLTQTRNDADAHPKAGLLHRKETAIKCNVADQTEGGANSSGVIEEPLCSRILTIISHN